MEESMLKGVRLFSIMAMLTLLFAVSLTSAQDKKVVVTGISMVGGDLPTIDPGLAETSSSIEVINQIFLGVSNQDYTSAAEPGLAESYDVSEDGKTFTFHLMPDVAWVRYNA